MCHVEGYEAESSLGYNRHYNLMDLFRTINKKYSNMGLSIFFASLNGELISEFLTSSEIIPLNRKSQ